MTQSMLFCKNCFRIANEKLYDLLLMQSNACFDDINGKDSRMRRWPPTVLNMCLSLWIACPVSYRIISKTLYLPCVSTLQRYKNSINKEPGVNQGLLSWLSKECGRKGTKKEGGIIFDEMHLQPGVHMEPSGDGLKMFGFVDFGAYNNGIHIFHWGGDLNIATTVLQFVFLAYDGFRFPFPYFLTDGVSAGHLTHIFWDIVNRLKTAGFLVSFICMDGAAMNRSFINRLCGATLPVAINIAFLEAKLACIMDFSHVVKKLRNSIYASGIDNCKRQLTSIHGPIYWKHFSEAYHWDKNNFLRINRKLTNDHFFLNCTLKMRNFLAEQHSDMLLLAMEYQKTLADPTSIQGLVELLRVTSKFIEIFRSSTPIFSVHDERLTHLHEIVSFFEDWHYFCNKINMKARKMWIISSQWNAMLI